MKMSLTRNAFRRNCGGNVPPTASSRDAAGALSEHVRMTMNIKL